MLEYLIRRILIFIPTLLIIALFTFILSLNAPGDPVEQILGKVQGAEGRVADMLATEQAYIEVARKLGLDLPVFYVAITPLSVPDTFYRIYKREHRKALRQLIHYFGNWGEIQEYYHSLRRAQISILDLPQVQGIRKVRRKLFEIVSTLLVTGDTAQIRFYISRLTSTAAELDGQVTQLCIDSIVLRDCDLVVSKAKVAIKDIDAISRAYESMAERATPWKNYIPAIRWYGTSNQFHRWLVGVLKGDFGISYKDQRPVKEVIASAIKWTLLINLTALVVIYLIAIPAGILMAVKKYSWVDRTLSLIFYALYSLPNFWIATLLIIFLASGLYLVVFPPYGVQSLPDTAPLKDRILDIAHHMVLPVICLAYPSLAFLARQMRGSMLDVLGQDYIRTAYAKGLPDRKVILKHAFRNSLLPIITLFANVFPFMVSGSFVIEYIFAIPGMGRVSYEGILSRDYPVVYTVVLLVSVMTLIGYLVADVLYAVVDPRITFKRK